MFDAIGGLLWDRLWWLRPVRGHLYQLCVLCYQLLFCDCICVSVGYWEGFEAIERLSFEVVIK